MCGYFVPSNRIVCARGVVEDLAEVVQYYGVVRDAEQRPTQIRKFIKKAKVQNKQRIFLAIPNISIFDN